MSLRPAATEPLALPPLGGGEAAIAIAEALMFLRREAADAGLAELADSLRSPIDTAARLAGGG